VRRRSSCRRRSQSHHRLTELTTCLPKARPDCIAYLVTLNKDHPFGQIGGTIRFELPESHENLNVSLGGIFLTDDTKIQSLNEPVAGSEADKRSRETIVPDIAETLKQAVTEQPKEAAPGPGPLLKWQVENEIAMYGYAVYRSDKEDGQFARVNSTIIAAANHGDNVKASYQWRDNTAVKGKEYWYRITIFYNDGRKVPLTGPQKVVAK